MKQRKRTATSNDSPSGDMAPKRRGGVIAVSVAAAVLLGGGAWQFQRVNTFPDLALPTPVMPVPNAYDDYVRAAGLAVEAVGGGDATGEPSTSPGGSEAGRGGSPLPPIKARLKLVALNGPAVRALRQGFTHPYLQPVDRSLYGATGPTSSVRALARMLAFASRAELDAGRADQAAVYGLDGVWFATDLARGGGQLDAMTAHSCETIARRPLWAIAEVCDAKTARTTARRLEEIERNRHPLAETVREQKYIGIVSTRDYFERKGARNIAHEVAYARCEIATRASGGSGSAAPLTSVAVGKLQAQILLKGRGRIVADQAAYMDRLIAASRLPFGAHVPLPAPPSDPANRELFTIDMERTFLRDAEAQMMTRLLTVRFALRAYQQERDGASPQTLAELVSRGYLRAVPTDPFAAPDASGALPPLGYRRGGKLGFVLYSVGPDGKDDSGKPINNPVGVGRAKNSQKRYVEAGTTGDFVVGVNAF